MIKSSPIPSPLSGSPDRPNAALNDLLAGYASALRVADDLPSLLTIRVGEGGFTRRLRVPRVKLFLQFFLAHHVRGRAALLQRRFHADAVAGLNREQELAALEHFEKAVPPVPVRRVIVWFATSVVLTAVVIAKLAQAIAPDPLSKASSALQGSLTGIVSVNPATLVEAAGRFDAASGVAACLAITLSLYVVGALPITSFRLKRVVMNLSPSTAEHIASTAVIYHTRRARGLYRDEQAVFSALGVRVPRELPLDLIAKAVLMLFPLVLGAALATANFDSLSWRSLLEPQSLGLSTVVWVCLLIPPMWLGSIWATSQARSRDADGAAPPLTFARAELALPSRRFAAFLIDAILMLTLAIPLVAQTSAGSSPGELAESTLLWFVAVPVWMLVVTIPFMLREGRHSGQSIGKQLVGIRVVSDDHGRLTLGPALVREVLSKSILLGGPSAALLFAPALLNGVWLTLDPERRGLEDRMARTRVIRASDGPS